MDRSAEILRQVKQFVLSEFPLSEIMAIILVGSYATGRFHQYSDIDIVIFKKRHTPSVERHEIRFQGYDLDIWFYDKAYFEQTFIQKATTSNHLGEISLFLGFLREAVIWYQEGNFLDKFIKLALPWEWEKCEVSLRRS